MAEVTITTDLDLDKVAKTYGRLIAKETMAEIGQAYRSYRQQMMWQGKQLHDLSASPPLKPETIARKRGDFVRKTRYTTKTGKARTYSVHGASLAPDVPLIDTGTLAYALDIQPGLGSLVVTIGSTRAEIGAAHQAGAGHLPQRVHLAWNQDFVDRHIKRIIANYYDLETRKAMHARRPIA